MGEEKKLNIRIGQVKDVNNRQVFSNHVLCAQFLRDYADLDILKNVQPEDIEDVTDKYQAYLGIEFETDTVKKIHLPEMRKESQSRRLRLRKIAGRPEAGCSENFAKVILQKRRSTLRRCR